MIELSYIALCLTAVPIFRTEGHYGIQEAKVWLFLALCVAWTAYEVMFCGFPALSMPGTAFLLYCAFATLSLAWCNHPRHAIRELLIIWGMLLFFLTINQVGMTWGYDMVLLAAFLPAPIFAAYGLLQQRWKRDPLYPDIQNWLRTKGKALRFFSFLESSNHSGNYLMLQAFIGAHLIHSFHWIFVIPTALVLWGLVESRCRSAYTGLITGILAVEPILIPCMIPVAIVGFVYMQTRRPNSNAHRLLMLRVALNMWKESPLIGHGPRVFRLRHYRTLMTMNFEDTTVHGEHSHTQGTKAHNDYAETLAEYGIVGFALLLAFLGLSLWSLWGESYLFGAGVAFCASMAFFYPFRDIPIALVFLALVGSINPPMENPIEMPGIISWLAIPVLFAIFMQHVWKPYRANRWHSKDQIWKAVNLEPTNGVYLNAATVKAVSTDSATAQVFAQRAIDWYDGELLEWMLFTAYGKVAMVNNALGLAKKAFEMALLLKPGYQEAMDALKQTNTILSQLQPKGGVNG